MALVRFAYCRYSAQSIHRRLPRSSDWHDSQFPGKMPMSKDQGANLFNVKVDLKRLHRRDREYLAWVMETFGSLVLSVAFRYADDENHARELDQACWAHVLDRLDRYRGKQTFAAWLVVVAKRRCLSLLRKEKRATAGQTNIEAAGDVPDPGLGPQEHAEHVVLQAAVQEALARLPDKQGKVIALTVLDRKSIGEAAGEMGMAPATVARLKERGLATLQRDQLLQKLHQDL